MKSAQKGNTKEPFIGCTIAPAAAAPQAFVLARSFLEFHPNAQFALLLVDRYDGAMEAPPNASLLGLGDLDLPPGEEWRLPMLFNPAELTSLLKPVLLQTLLKRGNSIVACFEYSTLILGPIAEAELIDCENAVVASAAIQNDYRDYGRSFIAVRSAAEAGLGSWFDQSWNENVVRYSHSPGDDRSRVIEDIFERVPHAAITSPSFAVCYVNLDPKTFTLADEGYEVDGRPLRSFDFRGYDPDKPHLLSRYQGLEPRILLSESPALTSLCDEYRTKVIGANYEKESLRRNPEIALNRLPIDERMRRIYREALDKFRGGQGADPPSPFGPGGEEGFLKWLNEPIGQRKTGVTRYMLAVWEDREDVQKTFPDPLGADMSAFQDWYFVFGRQELNLPPAVVPSDLRAADEPGMGASAANGATPAVNVAGFFRAELGLGVAARAILSALEAVGIPFNTVSFSATDNRQAIPFVDRQVEAADADINIICINPDLLPVFAEQTDPAWRHGRYTIGVWFWEVEDFPESLHGAFNYVDEIWVASDFMRHTFLKVSPKPVFKFPLPILTPQIEPSYSRRDLGLPDAFTFLFSFDLLSVLERKNPLGLVEAFKRAFPNGSDPALVIKTINGDKRVLEMEKLRYAIRGRPDIFLKEGYLSQIQNNALTALADCYVSLHRSEGYGLTIAEAMALGKPAIATAYSGNLEFMTSENSYLCPARRCEVGLEREPYPADSHWSEPDVEEAANLMRHVCAHHDEARARGLRAAEHILRLHSPEAAGPIMCDRFGLIRRRRQERAAQRDASFLEDRIEELEAENTRFMNQEH